MNPEIRFILPGFRNAGFSQSYRIELAALFFFFYYEYRYVSICKSTNSDQTSLPVLRGDEIL